MEILPGPPLTVDILVKEFLVPFHPSSQVEFNGWDGHQGKGGWDSYVNWGFQWRGTRWAEEVIQDSWRGFVKGRLYLTNLVAFCGGVWHRWTGEGQRVSSIWSSAKPLTWSLTTSFSLNWGGVDLKDGLFSGLGIGWLDAAKGLWWMVLCQGGGCVSKCDYYVSWVTWNWQKAAVSTVSYS